MKKEGIMGRVRVILRGVLIAAATAVTMQLTAAPHGIRPIPQRHRRSLAPDLQA